MAREDLTEIAIIMDESGSMQSTADDAIGGYNSFIASQKEVEGHANVTLVLFDNKYEIVHAGIDVKDIPDLSNETYNPGGGTALIDALSKTIDSVSDRINTMEEDEKPGKVIIIVITDGEENSSREYKRSDVAKKLKDYQSRDKWELIFIGASNEILDQADDLGFKKDKMMRYAASSGGTMRAYTTMSDAVGSYRSMGSYELPKDAEESKDEE